MYTNSIFNKIVSFLFVCLPISLIFGPFFTDVTVVIIGIYALLNHKKIKFSNVPNFFIIIFFIFYFYILINSLLSTNKLLSLESSLFYFRYFFFILGGIILINSDLKLFAYFFIVLISISLLLSLHSLYLFFFSQTYIDLCFENSEMCRISSLFNEELIMGSYLARIMPLIILALSIYLKNKYKNIIIFCSILLLILTCLISGERNSFLLSLVSGFLLILNYKKNLKILFSAIFTILLISTILIFSNDAIKNRLIDQTFDETFTSEKIIIISPVYNDLYLNAITLFFEKPIQGHGPKIFREICKKNKDSYPSGCSTHPHNLYLQLLSETGIIGTSFIFIFLIFCSYNFIINLFYYRSQLLLTKNYLYIAVMVNLFPLASSGNFFNNWLSCIYFLPLIFLWGINNKTIKNYANA